MTATTVDTTVLDALDFDHTPACETGTCRTSDNPNPAAALLHATQGCPCDGRYPICTHHAELVGILRMLHVHIVCSAHGVTGCAHDAYTIEPLP